MHFKRTQKMLIYLSAFMNASICMNAHMLSLESVLEIFSEKKTPTSI